MSKRQSYYRNRQNRPFLNLERLEDRTVPAFTGSVFNASSGILTGDNASDTLVIDQSGGLLRHNRFGVDAGFASEFDFDTTQAGVQTLTLPVLPALTINCGDGNDVVQIGTTTVPASTIAGRFVIDGEGGNDTVIWENSTDTTDRTVNVQGGIFNQVFIPFTGASVNFGPLGVLPEIISIRVGNGNDTINVSESLTSFNSTINAGGGNDTFNFGTSGELQALGFNVDGGTGTDSLFFNDQNNSDFNPTYTFDNHQVLGGGANVNHTNCENVTFNASQTFNSIVVLRTLAGVQTTINANAGGDTFFVGSNNNLDGISGSVILNGGTGSNLVLLNDQNDSGVHTYTLTNNTLTRSGAAGISFISVEDVRLNAGTGNDVINVTSSFSTIATTVNAGDGDDSFFVGNAGSLDLIKGPVTLNGNATNDSLTINDQNDAGGNSYTLTGTALNRSGAGLITYGSFENLTLNPSAGDLATLSGSTPGILNLTVNGNAVVDGASTLAEELAALNSFDKLNVTGTLNLNSANLDVSLLNGFNPSPGDSFTIIQTTAAITGQFAQGEQISLGGKTYDITYSSNTVVLTVAANPPPSNVVVNAPATVSENDQVTISGDFTNPDGQAHTVTIDFGDGTTLQVLNLAAGANTYSTTHVYLDDAPSGTSSDVKTITATVSDGVGSDSDTTTISVNNVAPSNANVTATPTAAGSASTITVSFTDPGTLDPHLIDIDFGDGTPVQSFGVAPGQSIFNKSHVYANVGTFTIIATVHDDDLGTAPAVQTTVVVAALIPVVTPPTNQTGSEGANTSFALGSFTDANNSGNYTVTVNWGDGTPDTVFNQATAGTITAQNHTYFQDGSFTVGITVQDADGTSTPATFSANVGNVLPNRTPPGTQNAFNGISQSFALGSFTDPGDDAPWTININWGDGTPNTILHLNAPGLIPPQNHTYAAAGTFALNVTVIDDDGSFLTSSQVIVANSVPVVTPPANQSGSEGTGKSFNLGSFIDANNSGNYTVTVNWGDGTANTVFNQTATGAITAQNHTYAQDGNFPVTVTVSDVDGSSTPVGFQANIGNVLPVAVDAPDQNGVATIAKSFALGSFTDPGADAPWHITVNWGDGSPNGSITVNTPGTLPPLTHTFANAGNFNVVVTVQDDDGSVTSDYQVHVIPPIAHLLGNVFRDFNNNGQVNAVDVGLAGVTVFADRDGDGELDANEPFTTTDGNGDYQLDVGFEGAVSVQQVIPDGFKQTTANPADVSVQFGDTVSVDSLGDNRIITPTIAVAGRLKSLPFVQVRNPDGTLRFSFSPFTKPASLKEVRLATGDVNDDGIEDVFVVPGPGASSVVKVFDGADGHLISSFTAFAVSFTGGASIAAGDVNGDGVADIVVGTEKGAGPLVKIFDGSNNQLIRSFVPTNATSKTGVKVAVGDVDGDGVVDVITAPGISTEHSQYRIRAQDALTGASLLSFLVNPVNHCVATLNVTAGDLDHDGRAEIILATSRIGQTQVQTFKNGAIKEVGLPLAANFRSTAFSVAAKDLTGDGIADLLFAGSQGQSPRLKLVNSSTGQALFSALLLGDKDRNGLIVG